MAELVSVPVPCPCPEEHRHEGGDTVYLRPTLGLLAGIAIQKLFIEMSQAEGLDAATMTGRLAEAYLLHGVADWTFLNGKGKVPVDDEHIRSVLLADFTVAEQVADAADDLYLSVVLDPLRKKIANLSPTTSTNGSTSPSRVGTPKRPKRSKRSSTTPTPTADTAATSG